MEAKEKPVKRSLDEAVTALWQVIDEAKSFLTDPRSTPTDKKTWAKILGDTIAVLNKVLMAQKGQGLEDEDIMEILKKVPERYTKEATRALKESIQARKGC